MTDEEMAEEYENAQDYCGLLDVLFEEQYNQDYGGLSCYISPYIEQAYLAGLKAGRPKWHKVADGDLPKEDNLVLFKTNVDYYIGKIDCSKKYWWTGFCRDYSISNSFVIAWCEIPKE